MKPPNPRNDRGRQTAWLGLIAASALLIAVVVPWDLQSHNHWRRVRWLPFISGSLSLHDVMGNMLLTAPIGGFAARVSRRPVLSAGILTLTLSLAGEWTQTYSHSRFPSATDVMCNVVGAVVAAFVVRRMSVKRASPRV